jgi:hypothetical protein
MNPNKYRKALVALVTSLVPIAGALAAGNVDPKVLAGLAVTAVVGALGVYLIPNADPAPPPVLEDHTADKLTTPAPAQDLPPGVAAVLKWHANEVTRPLTPAEARWGVK